MRTTAATASSTAWSDCARRRYRLSIASTSLAESRGSLRTFCGLSATFASLNEGGRGVARGVQRRGDGRLLQPQVLELREPAPGGAVVVDLVVVRIEPGEDGRARWAAERQGHEVLLERHPPLRDQLARLRHEVHGA